MDNGKRRAAYVPQAIARDSSSSRSRSLSHRSAARIHSSRAPPPDVPGGRDDRRGHWAAGGSDAARARRRAHQRARARPGTRRPSTPPPRVEFDDRGAGEGRQSVVERDDPRPIGLLDAGARLAGGDRGLQGVGAQDTAELLGALQSGQAAVDEDVVPAARSCSASSTGSPAGPTWPRSASSWRSSSSLAPTPWPPLPCTRRRPPTACRRDEETFVNGDVTDSRFRGCG